MTIDITLEKKIAEPKVNGYFNEPEPETIEVDYCIEVEVVKNEDFYDLHVWDRRGEMSAVNEEKITDNITQLISKHFNKGAVIDYTETDRGICAFDKSRAFKGVHIGTDKIKQEIQSQLSEWL